MFCEMMHVHDLIMRWKRVIKKFGFSYQSYTDIASIINSRFTDKPAYLKTGE